MAEWEVEYTDEFGEWWAGLEEELQDEVFANVGLIEEKGPHLEYPYSTDVRTSDFGVMRELRIQFQGEPWRVFYAFDPRRVAILLIGGCKGGDDRFYKRMVPQADELYREHLEEIGEV